MIQYLNSEECHARLEKLFELARKKFRGELIYDIDERTRKRNASPHSLCCAAYDTDTDQIVSYFSWNITDMKFRDGLVSGRYTENDLYTYDGREPAVLYFNTFIVTQALHAPFLIRHLIKELHALILADELDIIGGLSIGGLRLTDRRLRQYGFNEIGRYQKKYPILWARREEAPILNSLLKVYDTDTTHKPWSWKRN